MPKILAIANCRVSSDEQLLSNSLARQEKSVFGAAAHLGVEIIKVWSGSVSSKAGTNVNRKDLMEMIEVCKKNKAIKYAIFDEYDRFMRSVNEGPYFEVLFQQAGVKVWYASESDTFNGDDAMAKFMRTMSAYKAEGSNEERQRKSISGQTNAGKEGRYTYCPKPGYMKGQITGVHIWHPERGPALQGVLKRLAAGLVSPTDALIELNKTVFTKDRALYKMDKFRKVATDPYNAGIIIIDKQVKVHNKNGLHTPLVTLYEHQRIVEIIENKPKYQIGPKRTGNPDFPLSNFIDDDSCLEKKDRGRLVGVPHTNGKSPKVYKKYRCRSCRHSWNLDEMHSKINCFFAKYEMSDDTQEKILDALEIVWSKDDERKTQNIASIKKSIYSLNETIRGQVQSVTDPTNAPIKHELIKLIEESKAKIAALEADLERLSNSEDDDKKDFMKFAISFVENVGQHFLEPYISKANRLRCKQMLFPGGISIKDKKKVYTPELSAFYRVAIMKKDPRRSLNSHMVRVKRL